MPNRILREGILESERIHKVSPLAELFYRRIMSIADDYGRYACDVPVLLSRCFPRRPTWADESTIPLWIEECREAGLILVYEVNNHKYLEISDFRQQSRSKSKFPGPLRSTGVADAQQMQSESYIIKSAPNTNTDTDTTSNTNALILKFREIEKVWTAPCSTCGQQFPAKEVDLAARQWISLIDRGTVTEASFPAILEGLMRWRASEQWHRGGGQFVPSMASWFGFSKNGTPAEPRWNDHPVPQRESEY